jgi:hypothetical protein
MAKIWISNGISVNAAWYGHIAVSRDGVNWETINKEGLSVLPTFKSQGATNPPRVMEENIRCQISLSDFSGTSKITFNTADVVNQVAWNPTTLAGLLAAVTDITTWIGEIYNPSGGGLANQQEFMEVLIQDSLGDLYFMVRTLDEATGVYTISYINADGSAAVPVPPLTPYSASSGVTRTPSIDVIAAAAVGSTTAGVQGVSLHYIGTGGLCDGAAVPNGTIFNFVAKMGDVVDSISYTAPNGGAGTPRIIITYLT